jgi:tRNA A37 methylthiotransferase MiaB
LIKVQDGCRYRCTYCIVTLARGEERSRPAAEVIEEIKRSRSAALHRLGESLKLTMLERFVGQSLIGRLAE